MPINRKYGWAPDLPDHRDHLYSAPQPVLAKLPPKKDLRSGCPPVYDQGQLGSCTANAISGSHSIRTEEAKTQSIHALPAFHLLQRARYGRDRQFRRRRANSRWREVRREPRSLPGNRVAL